MKNMFLKLKPAYGPLALPFAQNPMRQLKDNVLVLDINEKRQISSLFLFCFDGKSALFLEFRSALLFF